MAPNRKCRFSCPCSIVMPSSSHLVALNWLVSRAHRCESPVLPMEFQRNCGGITVSLFCNDEFRRFAERRVIALVVARPVKESDQVGMLLQVSRITEVTHNWAKISSLLRGSGELGNYERRNLEFSGQFLQLAGDLSELLRSI